MKFQVWIINNLTFIMSSGATQFNLFTEERHLVIMMFRGERVKAVHNVLLV